MVEAAKTGSRGIRNFGRQGLVIDTSGPTEQQTKKSIVISVNTERYSAVICRFDSGACETDIADLASSLDKCFEDAVESTHDFFHSSSDLEIALDSVFSKVLDKPLETVPHKTLP